MVRLLRILIAHGVGKFVLFQSHNGAIAATKVTLTFNKFDDFFQSHNGAIAARADREALKPELTFNPTMVRLLRVVGISMLAAITTFNPTMVRLLLLRFVVIGQRAFLSIPQWCDCC